MAHGDDMRDILDGIESAGARHGLTFTRSRSGPNDHVIAFSRLGVTVFLVRTSFTGDEVRTAILRPGEDVTIHVPVDGFRVHPERSGTAHVGRGAEVVPLLDAVRAEADRHAVSVDAHVFAYASRFREILAQGGQAALDAIVRAVDDVGVRDGLMTGLSSRTQS